MAKETILLTVDGLSKIGETTLIAHMIEAAERWCEIMNVGFEWS